MKQPQQQKNSKRSSVGPSILQQRSRSPSRGRKREPELNPVAAPAKQKEPKTTLATTLILVSEASRQVHAFSSEQDPVETQIGTPEQGREFDIKLTILEEAKREPETILEAAIFQLEDIMTNEDQ